MAEPRAESAPSHPSIPLVHGHGDVPDGHGHDHAYKLIELPLELQSLLEGPDPPRITLEAGPDSGLLHTPDRTYSMRQKNTSNGLMILSVCGSAEGEPGSGGGGGGASLHIVATIHETVELIPRASGPAPAVRAESTAASGSGSKGRWHERFGKNR